MNGPVSRRHRSRRAILLGTVVAVAAVGVSGVALAKTLQYRAEPAGEFEVPANDSTAEGKLKLKLSSDGTELRYDLKITEPIDDVFMAHLHRGAVGTNGPIVVWLYPHPSPPGVPIPGSFEGRLARDVITADDLCPTPTAPFCGNWEGFLDALDSGGLYVNVHTALRPGGEIRDQVAQHGGHDD